MSVKKLYDSNVAVDREAWVLARWCFMAGGKADYGRSADRTNGYSAERWQRIEHWPGRIPGGPVRRLSRDEIEQQYGVPKSPTTFGPPAAPKTTLPKGFSTTTRPPAPRVDYAAKYAEKMASRAKWTKFYAKKAKRDTRPRRGDESDGERCGDARAAHPAPGFTRQANSDPAPAVTGELTADVGRTRRDPVSRETSSADAWLDDRNDSSG